MKSELWCLKKLIEVKKTKIEVDCLKALNLLKEYGELSAGEWSKLMGYHDSVRFVYIRQKTIESFTEQIGIHGKLKGTRYYYIESKHPPLKMPIAKDVSLLEGKVVSREELIKMINDFRCHFNGECNLKETEQNFCFSCSHQIRIPIPETVRCREEVSRLESEIEKLKNE